jgi:hypothetical protein
VYPAGTAATADLKDKIPAQHWTDGDHETIDGADAGDLAAFREKVDRALGERDQQITSLTDEVATLKAENDDLRAQLAAATGGTADDNGGKGEPTEKVDYNALDVDALKAEIDKRNEGRDSDAKISKRGGVETLVAALEADDAAQAEA